MKKPWKKPKLIVLVRGKSEERVLTVCKTTSSAATSSTDYDGCAAIPFGAPMAICGDCSTYGGS